jgi:ADP-ribosylglycohydrolase
MHPLYDIVLNDVRVDISQLAEEGHEEPALLAELEEARSQQSLDALLSLQEDLWQRPSPADYPYEEPNDWESISRHFPEEAGSRTKPDGEQLADRLLAGWQGRCAGCQLGKPVEGATSSQVSEVLSAVGHYAITGQLVLERHGREFTSQQAIDMLLDLTPVSFLWSAGRSMFRTALFGLKPPFTAIYGNPSRQSLGGQIRCDPWGWAAPGDPLLAARMAYRDAANSQTRNGIYSAIFFAVLIASALVRRDPVEALEVAERYVPPKSRFAEMLQFVKAECASQHSWEGVAEAIYGRYPMATRVMNHSLPNAAIVVMALLKGGGDFTDTIGLAVSAGLDTDCNGATAGSVIGCALGTKGIPAHWTDPFHDRIRTCLKGLPEVSISDMAERMHRIASQS